MSKDKRIQRWVDNIWPLIKKYGEAIRKESWLEATDLLYYILSFQLRIIMTSSTVGKNSVPLSASRVKRMRYLKTLADNAYEFNFIDKKLYEKILAFNSIRGKAVHKLMEGTLNYNELSTIITEFSKLQGEIQNKWLKVKVGNFEKT